MMISRPTALPPQLMGPMGSLGGKAEVENLQHALTNLAIATQRPQINPGPVTGVINDATMTAVSAGLGLLSEQLPTWAYLALQAAMIAGIQTTAAKDAVASAATQLTVAANTAAVKYKVQAPPTMALTPAGFFAPGWYKTPMGMGLIAVVAFLVYRYVIAPKKAA